MPSTINHLIDAQAPAPEESLLKMTLRKLASRSSTVAGPAHPYPVDRFAKLRGHREAYANTLAWYRVAAEKGDASAQLRMGYLYQQGDGVEQNDSEALKWYRLAVAQGQYKLGVRYAQGIGVPHDFTQTAKWYTLAAQHGHIRAQVNLGSMYCQGIGVEQDHGAAVKWYRMAAEQGDAIAQFNLAVSYVKGLGVTRDLGAAHMWLGFSARDGDEHAAASLVKLANNMTALQLDEARQLTLEYEASKVLPRQ